MRRKFAGLALVFTLLLPQVSEGDTAPGVKSAVAPKYPALILAGRIYGEVLVRVTIDSAGDVKQAKVTEGHPMLREAAEEAARQWKFEAGAAPKRVAVLNFSFVILADDAKEKSGTVFQPPLGIEIRQKPPVPVMEDQGGEFQPVQQLILTA